MSIADVLHPRLPAIDAARVTTHTLPDNGDETKENDMSNHSDVQKAVADCGGRATREEIGTATGFEGKELENAIYNAIKKYGLIRREGKDFVLVKPGSGGTSEAAAKPAKPAVKTAKKKPAAKAKKTAVPKAKQAQPGTPSFNDVSRVSSVERITSPSTPCPTDAEAYVLRDGSVLIIEDGMRIHLTESQYIAVLNTKE